MTKQAPLVFACVSVCVEAQCYLLQCIFLAGCVDSVTKVKALPNRC